MRCRSTKRRVVCERTRARSSIRRLSACSDESKRNCATRFGRELLLATTFLQKWIDRRKLSDNRRDIFRGVTSHARSCPVDCSRAYRYGISRERIGRSDIRESLVKTLSVVALVLSLL